MSARAAVLVIDDEPGMREMLSHELSLEGFEVETVESGQAAVEAVKRRRFDLALTDLKMPGMDGVATVEALRSLDPDIEVIVATGYPSVETAVACMKRGAYDYIQKPYDLRELSLLLERALQKSHLQGVVALYEASRALLATLQHAEIVELAVELAKRVLRADDAGLLLRREEDGRLALQHATRSGLPEEALVGLGREAAARGRPVRLPSAAAAPLPRAWLEAGFGSALVYPLAGKRGCLGALALLRDHASPAFVGAEVARGTVFANQVALALDNACLYRELDTKVTELVENQEQLLRAERLALAGQLATAVAHEINNPLTVVQANLNVLRDYSSTVGALWLAAKSAALYLGELQAPAADAHARRLAASGGGTERTEALVRDIADIVDETLDGVQRIAELVAGFTRFARPADPGAPERVRLAALLEECVAELSRDAARASRPIRVELRADCETRGCRADLRSAIHNILTYLGSTRPLAESREEILHVRLEEAAGRPLLVVVDDGLHLSPEARSRLFDPNIEIDHRRGRTMRLNISLALAHQLLLRNGARITVASSEAGGLQLSIDLPRAEE